MLTWNRKTVEALAVLPENHLGQPGAPHSLFAWRGRMAAGSRVARWVLPLPTHQAGWAGSVLAAPWQDTGTA